MDNLVKNFMDFEKDFRYLDNNFHNLYMENLENFLNDCEATFEELVDRLPDDLAKDLCARVAP